MLSSTLRQSLGPLLLSPEGNEVAVDEALGTSDHKIIGLLFSANWTPNNKEITDQLSKFTNTSESKPLVNLIFVSIDEDEEAFRGQRENTSWLAIPFSDKRRRFHLLRHYQVTNLPFLIMIDVGSGKVLSRVSANILLEDPDCKNFPWTSPSVKDLVKGMEFVSPNGEPVAASDILGENIIGLYFSAHWCPPCRAFTPELTKFYRAVKTKFPKFEIIFVTSDRSEDSFETYHSSMPWPAIRWKCSEIRNGLTKALEVRGIPTLVLLDLDLSIITRDGRYFVSEPSAFESFPWRPQTVNLLQKHHILFLLKTPAVIFFTDGEPEELQFGKQVLQATADNWYLENYDALQLSPLFYVTGEDEASDEIRNLANLEDVVPLLAIIDLADGTKYLMEEGVVLSESSVRTFVSRYTNGELIPCQIEEEIEEYTRNRLIDSTEQKNSVRCQELEFSDTVPDIFEETL